MTAASVNGFFYWGGWSALVALGTIGLAGATVWLGAQARKEVRDAWSREWAAQRPEVYPLSEREWVYGTGRYAQGRARLLPLKNGGRGPALNVRGEITAVSAQGATYEREIIAGTIAPGDLLDARLAPGGVEDWSSVQGVIRYHDLSGRVYEGRFEFSHAGNSNELAVTAHPTTVKEA